MREIALDIILYLKQILGKKDRFRYNFIFKMNSSKERTKRITLNIISRTKTDFASFDSSRLVYPSVSRPTLVEFVINIQRLLGLFNILLPSLIYTLTNTRWDLN